MCAGEVSFKVAATGEEVGQEGHSADAATAEGRTADGRRKAGVGNSHD